MLNKFICALVIATQISSGTLPFIKTEPPSSKPEHTYIIHASGEIDSHYSTNSREALRNAYKNGNRIIELDFCFTSDGIPVCIHDWNEAILPGTEKHVPSSLDNFISNRIYGKFTPMTLEDLTRFMTLYEDLYIVSDVKDANIEFCRYLSEHHQNLKNRFIIQV